MNEGRKERRKGQTIFVMNNRREISTERYRFEALVV